MSASSRAVLVVLATALAAVGCGGSEGGPDGAPTDAAGLVDAAGDGPRGPDAAGLADAALVDAALVDADLPRDGGTASDGGGGTQELTPIDVTSVGGVDGVAVHDVAIDEAGGVWATTDDFVVYAPKGQAPRRYDATDGLATGDPTVRFEGVGAGKAGQAFVGTRGRWVDVVDVRADGGLDVHHLTIDSPLHADKVTIGFRFAVDLDAAYGGTVWMGAEHGHSALHGIRDGYCFGADGCFEEHRHSDPSGGPAGDVKGLAVCPGHDLWTGDQHWIGRMPYGADGATPDFWAIPPDGYPSPLLDGWPGTDDHVSDMDCGPGGDLWVASYGNGLLRLDTTTLGLTYFDESVLPQGLVTAVLVDDDGSVWVGTSWRGLARYRDGAWTYHGEGAGLPSDTISSLAIDRTTSPRRILIGHAAGLSAYAGP